MPWWPIHWAWVSYQSWDICTLEHFMVAQAVKTSEECQPQQYWVIVDWALVAYFIINDDALGLLRWNTNLKLPDETRAQLRHVVFELLWFESLNQVQSLWFSFEALDWYLLLMGFVDAVIGPCFIPNTYSGPWTPNIDGGNLNYEGVHFLRRLNAIKNEHQIRDDCRRKFCWSKDHGSRKKVDLALTINGIWGGWMISFDSTWRRSHLPEIWL